MKKNCASSWLFTKNTQMLLNLSPSTYWPPSFRIFDIRPGVQNVFFSLSRRVPLLHLYRVIKKSLCTWWLQYRKLQVMFKVFPASLQTFIDTPNCVLEDRVRYSTVHIPNASCAGHLQIISCVGFVSVRCTETFWSPCISAFKVYPMQTERRKVKFRQSVHTLQWTYNATFRRVRARVDAV